jgi:glycosyltransferase involved in cell wall biosynthesis
MRVAVIGHAYHQKTRSSRFLIDLLEQCASVDLLFGEPGIGANWEWAAEFDETRYDAIVIFQLDEAFGLLSGRHPSVVFVPMYDSIMWQDGLFWKPEFNAAKIACFSWALRQEVMRQDAVYAGFQYYPDPAQYPVVEDFSMLRGFLWYRTQPITPDHVFRLSQGSHFESFLIHNAPDPGHEMEGSWTAPPHIGRLDITTWSADHNAYAANLRTANVFFAPRLREGIGTSVLEAMASGLCVVAPDAPTMNEYISNGTNGLLYTLERDDRLDFTDARRIGARARESIERGHQRWLTSIPALLEFILTPTATVRAGKQTLIPVRNRFETERLAAFAGRPLVSVVTVCRNAEATLEDTMVNVLGQTGCDFEYVLVDGLSTDGTLAIIQRYAGQIAAWRSGKDYGPYDAMNQALELARGEWVLFMNAGDSFVSEDALRRMFAHLPADADVVHGHHIYRQDDGSEALRNSAEFDMTWSRLQRGDLWFDWLSGIPCHQATAVRRDLLTEMRFDPRYRIAADHDLMFKVRAEGARFFNCDEVIAIYVGGGLSARQYATCRREWAEIARAYGDVPAADRFYAHLEEVSTVAATPDPEQGISSAYATNTPVAPPDIDPTPAPHDPEQCISSEYVRNTPVAPPNLDALHLQAHLRMIYASNSWRYTRLLRRLGRLLGHPPAMDLAPEGLDAPALRRQIEAIRQSTSWRIMGPLRVATRRIRESLGGVPSGQRMPVLHDASQSTIMGTNRIITHTGWHRIAQALGVEPAPPPPSASLPEGFVHSGSYVVSAIASLYEGGRYIDAFLRNITQQTWFDRSELIIIDAASPDGEAEVIAAYQREFPNIVYYRADDRIGIYEAWNIGVGMARGRYLTNTNLDDLRRADSFELQASALDRHGSVDVIYQDFYYSFNDMLDFDQVARVGIKSELPKITPRNLLAFNSPHNAPMWRKTLHDRMGMFDTTLKSAGDYEFWLRCVFKGIRFLKVEPAHIVYFQNPQGISTRPETAGVKEGRQLLQDYGPLLQSPEHGPAEKAAAPMAEDVVPLLAAAAEEFQHLGQALDCIGQHGLGRHLYELASAIDQTLPVQPDWWSNAFNGQEGRSRLFLRLLDMLRPRVVVETGTFRGTTTAFIASHFARRILTCEIDSRWYLTAQAKLAAYANVEMHQMDSRTLLRTLLAEQPTGTIIYYLDAHWGEDLPLREEIELILGYGQPAVIMIDDFAVPADPDYRYDDYGPGKTLSVAMLKGISPRDATLFFPTLPACEETGARRGCAVIGVGAAVTTVLAGLTELQPQTWPEGAREAPTPMPAPAPDQSWALATLQLLATMRADKNELAVITNDAD